MLFLSLATLFSAFLSNSYAEKSTSNSVHHNDIPNLILHKNHHGLRELTPEDWEKIRAIPEFKLPGEVLNRPLLSKVDNAQLKYFRPVWSQCAACCGQASGTSYNYTYEINYLKDAAGDTPQAQCPSHYTWNFLNGGEGWGTWYFDGWELIASNGCPSVADFGSNCGDATKWMSGYEKYYRGMHNRVKKQWYISVADDQGLQTLKNWLYDRGDGSSAGGLACFCGGSESGTTNDLSATSPTTTMDFAVFDNQGGSLPMTGDDETIEIGLDVTPLLNEFTGSKAKLFFTVNSNGGSGEVLTFSALDYQNHDVLEVPCTEVPVTISGTTTLSLIFDSNLIPLVIETDKLPLAKVNQQYSHTLTASGGTPPYTWELMLEGEYIMKESSNPFPQVTDVALSPDTEDDGYAEQALAFSFPFFDREYTTVYPSTDGSLLFNPGFEFIRDKDALLDNKAISVLGADFIIESGDYMYYSGDANSATFRWKTIHMYDHPDVNVDFAVTLFPSGKMEFFYEKDLSDDIDEMVIGISGGNGGKYVSGISNSGDIPDNYAFTLTPPSIPGGMSFSTDGEFGGIPTEDNRTWDLKIIVKDNNKISKSKIFTFSTTETAINPGNINTGITFTKTIVSHQNGKVTFVFNTVKAGLVTLDIFNAHGQKIRTLINKHLNAGIHKVHWDVNRDKDRPVSAGVYFCKLSSGKVACINKIILAK